MGPLRWRKQWVSDEPYESVGVFDVDGDGIPDIVSGAYWYKGPDYRAKYAVSEVKRFGEYHDDFSTIPLDVNGDGRMDFITGGFWGGNLRWIENPGEAGKPWTVHEVGKVQNVETTRAWDIDGDGIPEIVPNSPGERDIYCFKLVTDKNGKGTGKFERKLLHTFPEGQTQDHGFGCGDIAGHGRKDLLFKRGWLECPAKPWEDKWIWHEDFPEGFGVALSCPAIIEDINGDGKSELIVGNAHGYGLDWWEQKIEGGKRTWIKHPIDPFNAQFHDLQWLDIDGDGKPELITGKRHRAHCGAEPGEWDDYGIYYYKWTGEGFAKQIITYGSINDAKGCGIFFEVKDLNGDGRPEIIAPGKDGLCIFWNEGPGPQPTPWV